MAGEVARTIPGLPVGLLQRRYSWSGGMFAVMVIIIIRRPSWYWIEWHLPVHDSADKDGEEHAKVARNVEH